MPEIVFIGGFGSSPAQCESLARTITESSGSDTMGMCLRQALEDPLELARRTEGKQVISYSAGNYALSGAYKEGARFSGTTAIAPVNPERVKDLLTRGAAIGLYDPAATAELQDKVATPSNDRELILHPRANFGVIPKLAEFCTLDFLAQLAQEDVPTRVGFMSNDRLFNFSNIEKKKLEMVQKFGVEVCIIAGSHNRFSRDPIGVLAELDVAPNFDSISPNTSMASLKESMRVQIAQRTEKWRAPTAGRTVREKSYASH